MGKRAHSCLAFLLLSCAAFGICGTDEGLFVFLRVPLPGTQERKAWTSATIPPTRATAVLLGASKFRKQIGEHLENRRAKRAELEKLYGLAEVTSDTQQETIRARIDTEVDAYALQHLKNELTGNAIQGFQRSRTQSLEGLEKDLHLHVELINYMDAIVEKGKPEPGTAPDPERWKGIDEKARALSEDGRVPVSYRDFLKFFVVGKEKNGAAWSYYVGLLKTLQKEFAPSASDHPVGPG